MSNFVYAVLSDHSLPHGIFENRQEAVELTDALIGDKKTGVCIARYQRMTKFYAENDMTQSWIWDGSEVVYYNRPNK